MRNRNKNIIWGLFFIAAAVMIICQKQFDFLHISIWTILLTVVFGVTFIDSLRKLEWGGMLFSLAFLAIVYDDILGITDLTPWPVLGAALLGTIGLNMIFHKKPHVNVYNDGHLISKKEPYEDEQAGDDIYRCETAFSTSVKYVNSQDLKEARLENSFGKLTVFFDNAILHEGRAYMDIENSFGETEIFIPREWHADLTTEQSFGHVTCIGECALESDNIVKIKAESSFGSIVINYV